MARRCLLIFSLLTLTLCGCGVARTQAPPPDPPATTTNLAAVIAGNGIFAGRLLEQLAGSEQNVALSPFSISDDIAMVYAGARGATAAEIARALDFDLPPARLHAAFLALTQALRAAGNLRIADALYGQRGMAFRSAFLAITAGMRTVDFRDAFQAARGEINGWISRQTGGRIQQLLAPQDIDQLTRLVLVDAVHLKAGWALPFEKRSTTLASFDAPGGTLQVPTMHQTAAFPYLQAPTYRALELPYRGGRLAFDILLPRRGGLKTLLPAIARSGPSALLRGLRPRPVAVSLPKLKIQTRFELPTVLESLGMRLAFEPDRADLSGMAGRPGDLYLKTVVHEAYLRVDEAGTEAAAATASVVELSDLMIARTTFDVDRPFVFVLRDRASGAILFTGTVARP